MTCADTPKCGARARVGGGLQGGGQRVRDGGDGVRSGGAECCPGTQGGGALTRAASACPTNGAGHAAEVDVASTHQGNSSSRHDGSVARGSLASPPSSKIWTSASRITRCCGVRHVRRGCRRIPGRTPSTGPR
ncbi:hypothetical protein GZL_02709 [Streptomyces sp. 769]|nr:hypothetical protein GZL_02709 [Streptomyces sp. 769]